MHASHADRHYERFRRTGSPKALGAVYDLVAPELLGVATHLAGDPVLAEDLLQLTFVTAIERARSFRPGAPVLPWLLGILAQHAKAERRRLARRPDPLRVELRSTTDPAGVAELGELDERVQAALSRLGDEQRSVLVLRLRHGLGVAEIADALGRPAGTVRSQLARGLERLRAALPDSLGAGALAALGLPRGLEGVRELVTAHAASVAPGPLANVAGQAALAVAGFAEVLVVKKLVVVAAVFAACMLGLHLAGRNAAGPSQPDRRGVAVARPPAPEGTTPAPLVGGTAEPVRDAVAAPDEAARAEADPTAPVQGEGELELHVVDARGRAVGGAMCSVTPVHPDRSDAAPREDTVGAPRHASAGPDGVARFPALRAGTFAVRLHRGVTESAVVRAGETTVQRLLVPEGVDVEGRVVDGSGHPVAGAEIWLSERWSPKRGGVTTVADALGRFRLLALQPDNFVGALAPRHAISYVQPPRGEPGDTVELTIVLGTPAASVRVLVVDDRGRPIEGARVLVGGESETLHHSFPDGSTTPGPPPLHGTTDADGRITFASIGLGAVEVQARAPGYGPGLVVVTVRGDTVADVRLTLGDEATIVGRVVDAEGDPVEHAEVRAGERHRFASTAVTSDRDGRFTLAGLAGGAVEVQAEKRLVGSSSATVTVVEGTIQRLELLLVERPRIQGQVVDADGEAVAYWTVVARDDATHAQVGATSTLANGWFDLDLRGAERPAATAGTTTLLVRPPGDWRALPALVQHGVRPSPERLLLRLPRPERDTGTLRLTPTDPDGMSVADARLELLHVEHDVRLTLEPTSADGRFALDGVLPGTLELALRHAEHPLTRLEPFVLLAGESKDLGAVAFSPSGSLTGTLEGLDDEVLLGALQIHVSRQGGETGIVQRFGPRFSSNALTPGDYLLSVVGDHVEPVYRQVRITSGVEHQVRVRLERAGLCRVTLQRPEGEPPPRWVGARAWTQDGRVAWSGACRPLEDGRFEARVSVAPGRYRFEAHDDEGRSARTELEVLGHEGESPGHALVLRASGD